MPAHRRTHMITTLSAQDVASDALARAPARDDQAALGALILEACLGTIDYEGETLEESVAEIGRIFDGGSGSFMANASELVLRDGRPVNATLVTMFEDAPFVAYSFTAPAWQSLAGAGMQRCMNRLLALGYPTLALVVTHHNAPAWHLYTRLGFAKSSG